MFVRVIGDVFAWRHCKKTDIHIGNMYSLIVLNVYMFCGDEKQRVVVECSALHVFAVNVLQVFSNNVGAVT